VAIQISKSRIAFGADAFLHDKIDARLSRKNKLVDASIPGAR
jgi:hypothetical protein